MADQLVAANLFDVDGDDAVLIGGKCEDCGNVAFPFPTGCARCTSTSIVEHRLATEGDLWTYTIQAFRPKPPYDGPAEFEPFGLGYLNLGGEVLVEGWLTVADLDAITIGMPMRTVTQAYKTDANGDAVLTYAFAPKEA
jgi:uncharacterized OB-fold protein